MIKGIFFDAADVFYERAASTNGLAKDPSFEALYAEIYFIPTDYYGDKMSLYQRRDLAGTTP